MVPGGSTSVGGGRRFVERPAYLPQRPRSPSPTWPSRCAVCIGQDGWDEEIQTRADLIGTRPIKSGQGRLGARAGFVEGDAVSVRWRALVSTSLKYLPTLGCYLRCPPVPHPTARSLGISNPRCNGLSSPDTATSWTGLSKLVRNPCLGWAVAECCR